MKKKLAALKMPALAGLMPVFPFLALELVNRQKFEEGLPLALFAVLWLLAVLFIVLLVPVVQNVRMGQGLLAHPLSLVARVASSALVALLWMAILMDQMPCFLGVPLCD